MYWMAFQRPPWMYWMALQSEVCQLEHRSQEAHWWSLPQLTQPCLAGLVCSPPPLCWIFLLEMRSGQQARQTDKLFGVLGFLEVGFPHIAMETPAEHSEGNISGFFFFSPSLSLSLCLPHSSPPKHPTVSPPNKIYWVSLALIILFFSVWNIYSPHKKIPRLTPLGWRFKCYFNKSCLIRETSKHGYSCDSQTRPAWIFSNIWK